MSASDDAASWKAPERAPLTFGTIVVVGGGCYGRYYVRQLRRAAHAGAVSWQRISVIDRDQDCAIMRAGESPSDVVSADGVRTVICEWREFFREYLGWAAENPSEVAADAIVPSPLMPHLMFEWIYERARKRWPQRSVMSAPLEAPPGTPWQRATPGGPHYVSFAEWMCPINCIEPRTCPHTRAARSWSLPDTARDYVEREKERGRPLVGPVIFHCTHRAYGVGMFDTLEVLEGDAMVRSAAADSGVDLLVGTMSHCHGAFQRLVIGAPVIGGSPVSRHW